MELELLIGGFNNVIRRGDINRVIVAMNNLPLSHKHAVVHACTVNAFNEGWSHQVIGFLAPKVGLQYTRLAGGAVSSLRPIRRRNVNRA